MPGEGQALEKFFLFCLVIIASFSGYGINWLFIGDHDASFWDFVTGVVFFIAISAVYVGFAYQKDKKEKAEAERIAAAKAKKERLAQLKSEQARIAQRLQTTNQAAVDAFDKLPGHLENAHQYLDSAIEEFDESAYIPFWTAIENAATELASFIELVDRINVYSIEYTSLAGKYKGEVDPFAVSLAAASKLRVSEGVSHRIAQVIRPAHKDPHFAQIFLQMRTNAILVAGFENLADALGRMTVVLSNAISKVNSSIDEVGSKLNRIDSGINSLNVSTQSLNGAVTQSSNQLSSHYRGLERQQARSVHMLDNIQHHRRPLLG
ncbi:hypothetical protein C6A86_017035 [Mycobacterium sp. ITM-2016-00316]|uniref:hypothetical protein n=1 Tax=Mycobacterium sp. ITM-2016-00316 TaxID=2099695 RepID=UPI000CF890C3|nr:hypothetical protein [Mycobacterium sp. ITM-2016-00316]WNG79970.1 hypothetical protein C6A86_017035 [Mycobacterium sp. ITM-2016-00316]